MPEALAVEEPLHDGGYDRSVGVRVDRRAVVLLVETGWLNRKVLRLCSDVFDCGGDSCIYVKHLFIPL
jgi:hypothetical protein